MSDNKFKFLINEDYTTYYNPQRLFSYSDIHMFILIGGRGIGKTTSILIRALKDRVKKGEEFVYIRRYKDETVAAKSVLDPIAAPITTKGVGVKGCFAYMYKDKRLGYGVALSVQHKLKSGVDFTKVKNIIFDEAIIQNGGLKRYINNEITELFELISTIVRTRTNYNIYIIGNNLDLFNPYFAYFNVPRFDNIYVNKERGLYCELCKNKAELIKLEQETPLYKLTKDTAYGEYHYNNEILMTETGAIGVKSLNARLLCRINYNKVTLNIYSHLYFKMFVEYRDKDIRDDLTFIVMEDNNPNYLYIRAYRQSDIRKFIEDCYYNGDTTYNESKAISLMSMFMNEIK